MPIKYTNRKNKPHYLIAKLTKKGKERYYIVKNIEKYDEKDLLNKMPEGYEFYEFPYDAKVVLRKTVKRFFTEKEKTIVDIVMQNHETVKSYIIDLEKSALVIYIAHLNPDLAIHFGIENFIMIQSYDAKLRIIKKDKMYAIQRYCYLGSYNDWIIMEAHENLAYLCEKYCFYIDKKSLLKFWIDGEVFEDAEYDDW